MITNEWPSYEALVHNGKVSSHLLSMLTSLPRVDNTVVVVLAESFSLEYLMSHTFGEPSLLTVSFKYTKIGSHKPN